MKITNIRLIHIQIPFTTAIHHNLKNRQTSNSIVIELQTEKGQIGYGEGAPRNYVTGEKVNTLFTAFEQIKNQFIGQTIDSIADIEKWTRQIWIQCPYPALLSAIEIAFFDLLGKEKSTTVGHFLSHENHHLIPYSAVLPFLPKEKLINWLLIVKQLNIKQLKIKVGSSKDVENLKLARHILGDEIDIRVDANRAWSYLEAIEKIKRLEPFNISGVEEPIRDEAFHFLPKLSEKIAPKIVLDESVYTLDHAQFFALKIAPEHLLFNLKISKCGGLQRTSTIHQFAHQNGIACQLGCNVGETAILSAAGRIFAQTHPLKYLEGSFGRFFMADDLVNQAIHFGQNGWATKMKGAGLGIAINPDLLAKFTVRQRCSNRKMSNFKMR